MAEPAALRDLAAGIAREAGALLVHRLHDIRTDVATKSSATDMVSEVDRESEVLIVSRILAARPGDAILGEEGASREGSSGLRWVIDPLDGTTNYLYKRGDFCVSIGIERGDERLAAVVFDPVRDELFAACRGGGSTLNGEPIAVTASASLATALVGTGFGYDTMVRARQGTVVARVLPSVRDIRRGGSAALDLCAVACGRLDAYYESGLNPWDMAAGILVIEEAGGRVAFIDIPGERRAVVAAHPDLWDGLARVLLAED